MTGNTTLNRGTGLLIIEVRHSNPNGDPDAESEPRTLDADRRGLISPVSFKRKVRDLVADKDGPVWSEAKERLGLGKHGGGTQYDILESRGRDRKAIGKLNAEEFKAQFWDGRIFGSTFLEDGNDAPPGDKSHFIATGAVQFGPGISLAPIEVERLTTTNKPGVQEGKKSGMAPLAWRVVRHAVYAMPFFLNPTVARKTGCSALDIDLLKFIIPHAYRQTASAVRAFVEVHHAWYAEHRGPLGSCPDFRIIDALTPRRVKGNADQASLSLDEYDIPTEVSAEIRSRLASLEDLCVKNWA